MVRPPQARIEASSLSGSAACATTTIPVNPIITLLADLLLIGTIGGTPDKPCHAGGSWPDHRTRQTRQSNMESRIAGQGDDQPQARRYGAASSSSVGTRRFADRP
jgi:hypothetical protein